MKTKRILATIPLLALLSTFTAFYAAQPSAFAQGTAFTYQGRLNSGANPATGIYDLRFTIYDAMVSGNPVGVPVTNSATGVTNGLFTVTVDFGSGVFTGPARWLQLDVRTNGGSAFTELSPREPVLPMPYAIFANTASNLLGTLPATQLGGTVANSKLANNSITVTAGTGLTGGGTVALGGSTTLNNGGVLSVTGNGDITVSAASGNVTLGDTATSANTPSTIVKRNASGNFSAGTITLSANLNLPVATSSAGIIYSGGNTFLHASGSDNIFAGMNAGGLGISGSENTGVGSWALHSDTSGSHNTANGYGSLYSNTNGSYNTANGEGALNLNTSGNNNTANGYQALQENTNGSFNTSIGFAALLNNTSGSNNIALGSLAGDNITTGSFNIDIGNGGVATDTNIIRIGSGQTSTFIAGVINGNGGGLTNLDTSHFGSDVLTNGQNGITLGGTFSGALSGNGASLTNVNAAALNGLSATSFWQLGGNSVSSGQFLGSTNFQPVEIWVNNTRALRLEPMSNNSSFTNCINVVGGSPVNSITPGVYGSVIAGGGGEYSFIGGWVLASNSISANFSFIGGGYNNSIQTNAPCSFIGGGLANSIQTNASESFLGGGAGNSIQTNAYLSFLGGGDANSIQANAYRSFLGGGTYNSIQTNAQYSVLGGGKSNVVSGVGAVVVGGGYDGSSTLGNTAGGAGSVVVGGTQNIAIGSRSTVGGGHNNSATNYYATIPGGAWNVAGGQGSFAAGQAARALHDGSFVWNCDYASTLSSSAANQFMARAEGGFYFYTGSGSSGATLAAGSTSWSVLSDRNAKKDFAAVNPVQILDKLAAVPISQWHYKWESADTTPNIGPMAQDFKAAFYPGRDDKSITTLEFDGVELAAIQGLNRKLEQKETEITELKARLERLEQLVISKNGGGQ